MIKKLLICTSLVFLTACSGHQKTDYSGDPMESFNRKIYSFNKTFDGMIMKPLAVGYKNITPTPVNNSITNFFNNMTTITSMINDVFQFNFNRLAKDFSTFFLNTTFGVLGFIDVASSFDLANSNNDFGLTLSKWGVKKSDYFVMPFLGPSTLRDGLGTVVDIAMPGSPFNFFVLNPNHRIGIFALRLIDLRANLLGATSIISMASIDEYAFVRDAYLQRRNAMIEQTAAKSPEKGEKSNKSMSDAVNVLIEDEHFGDEALFADALKEENKKVEEQKKLEEEKNKEKSNDKSNDKSKGSLENDSKDNKDLEKNINNQDSKTQEGNGGNKDSTDSKENKSNKDIKSDLESLI